jgi:hypothetical protein
MDVNRLCRSKGNRRIDGRWLAIGLVWLVLAALPWSAQAYDSVTATKAADNTTTPASFTLTYDQEIEWLATRTGSSTSGDAFCVHSSGGPDDEECFSTSLPSGYSIGTHWLTAGTYSISIEWYGMGPGSYTVHYNRTASISVSPSYHDFGSYDEGDESSNYTFTISSTGDLDVLINNVTSSSPSYFEVSSAPSGQVVPPNRTFRVKFKAGSVPGSHTATITVDGEKDGDHSWDVNTTATVEGYTVEPVPDIDCYGGSCGSASYLGSADHTIGEVKTFSYSFTNDGGAPLILYSVDLYNSGSYTVFSLSSPVSLASVAAGGNRSASIRFAPPASGGEATYCGYLEIQSNDPDEPTKHCYFQAKAHHPVPDMRLSASTLDYGMLELGYSYQKALYVYNDGDARLDFTIADNTPAADQADLNHWVEVSTGYSASYSVGPSPSSPQEIIYTYQPQDISSAPDHHDIQLRITSNDPATPTANVYLTGECIPPIPVDAVLVLDRSGSMSGAAGSWTKIYALRIAASLFTDLLRPSIPGSGFADGMGFSKYNHNSSVYLPFGLVNSASHVNAAIDALSDAAINDVGRLKPDGYTSIGGGMQTGAGILPAPAADRKQVMVVLTDGIENRTPYVSDVLPGITGSRPDLRIYSVGLGDQHDGAKLQEISNVTNGVYYVAGTLEHATFYDLEAFYFKILANATAWQIVADPTVEVDLTNPNTMTIATATIVSSDRAAIFVVMDEEYLRPYYKLELVDPQRQVIDLGTLVGGVPVHKSQRYNYTIYRVVFPDVGQAHAYVGDWDLRITPVGRHVELAPGDDKNVMANRPASQSAAQGKAPIGFVAAVGSDYKLDARIDLDHYQPGATVTMLATLTDRGEPATDGHVTVEVTDPGGTTYAPIELCDDGTHGDLSASDGTWTNRFQQTGLKGTYRFFFRSIGKNYRGELTPREAVRYATLTIEEPDGHRPPPEGRGRCCLPCWLLWIIIVVAILVLVLALRRRGRR